MYGNYPAYNPVPDPAMAAMQERLKNMQQQQAYRPMPPQPAMPMYGIKGRPVTNIEEARAAQIDFDGSTSAIRAEGEATRALINHNVMQDLRDKLADRDRDLLTANFQLSQQAQSANIIGTLRPFPQPAYITCSPYQAASTVYGCGCANSCGC